MDSFFFLQPTLQNEIVLIRPLFQNDFDALYSIASDPLIWEQHPNKNRYQKEIFKNYFNGAIKSGGAFLILDHHSKEVIGCTRFYDLDLNKSSILIGYTFLSRKYWGTNFNRSVKTLMINYALQFVDSVIFHIGANNIRSQKAIEKLGAIKIGEEDISYYGEAGSNNFVYKMDKMIWNKI